MFQTGLARVRKQINVPQFANFFLGDGKKVREVCWRRTTKEEAQ